MISILQASPHKPYRSSLTTRLHKTCADLAQNLHTLWLFTYSDLKTVVTPSTVFGVATALCASELGLPSVSAASVVRRAVYAILWTWLNLLPFSIDNQRQPLAVAEDSINKPWRPMPARRLPAEVAKMLMLGLYSIAIFFSTYVGGLKQCLLLIAFGYWYNNLGGADMDPYIRNLINACGFLCYTSGAMEVTYGQALPLRDEPRLLQWIGSVGGAVFTSVHSQDMEDQNDDLARGRRTVPLVIGDRLSRLTLALAVTTWPYGSPAFWDLGLAGSIPTLVLGALVTLRSLTLCGVEEDKMTFKLWTLWLTTFYLLPAVKFYRHRTIASSCTLASEARNVFECWWGRSALG